MRMYLLAIILVMASCKPSAEKFGNEVVALIEQFQAEHGRLPDDLAELGIQQKEEGPVFYETRGENEYILWYGAQLGESVTYNSKTGAWK